jgi:hypothetical protein
MIFIEPPYSTFDHPAKSVVQVEARKRLFRIIDGAEPVKPTKREDANVRFTQISIVGYDDVFLMEKKIQWKLIIDRQ